MSSHGPECRPGNRRKDTPLTRNCAPCGKKPPGAAGTSSVNFVVAESAKRGAERLAFNKIFKWVSANAKKENINAILSHKLDRVCRNMRDAVRLQELEDKCGVQLAFVENQFGPGAAGALSFNVMAAVAQYYSDNLRQEVLKGMDEKVRQGWPTGHAPFGYLNADDKTEPVKPHPEKSGTLVRIFELYATGQYTLHNLSRKLYEEGHVFQTGRRRFHRTCLSYILKNRFYVGEIRRNDKIYPGKYKLLIARRTFDACQAILSGKNRRTGNPEILFSGGIFKCAFCGASMSGEQIRRRLGNGDVNVHVYYKCANNHRPDDHPNVRWREEDIEAALLMEFDAIRMPSEEIADWLRHAISEAFADASYAREQWRKTLKKRKSELEGMQERLLNGYLGGVIDETTFHAKSAEFKKELDETNRQVAEAMDYDPERGKLALSVFDFSQNLAKLWHGSNSTQKRQILECLSSNRELSDVSLYLVKRKPFDFLEKRPFVQSGRGEWRSFEPSPQLVTPITTLFDGPTEPFVATVEHLVRLCA